MSSKEESLVFVIENVIGALNDIHYEMENFNVREGFSMDDLKSYISNAEKGLNDLRKCFEGGVG